MAAVTKKGRSRRALTTVSHNDTNISVGTVSSEKATGLAAILSPQKPKRAASKNKAPASTAESSLSDELLNLQARLEQLQLEKANTEELLQIVGQEKRENEAMKLLEEEQMQKTAKELLDQYLQFKHEAENNNKKSKKEKDPLKPKQPMSAFFQFSKERRTTLLKESNNILEIAKIAGEEWKDMTEEQKAPYVEIAKKEKEEYNRQMEMYKQKKLEEVASTEKEEEEQKKVMKQEALQLLKKKEKTENIIKKTKEDHQKMKKQKEEQNVDTNKPKKPASSFFLFSKEARKQLSEERPGICNSTLNALISVKWKELSDTEKQIWNEKAAKAMAAYKKEMEEYNKTLSMSNNVS